MLQRIITIKNVGRFENFNVAGDVTFSRYTFIFGENARGKTTFCALLRSLAANAPDLVVGRKTLGSVGSQEIRLRTNLGIIEFRNGAWNSTFPNIVLFDGNYVSENVFDGDQISADHRRNLYRVIIGAEGVALASRVAAIDEEVRGQNAKLREARAQLQIHAAGMDVQAFIDLKIDPDVDAKILAKEQELQAAQRAMQIQQRQALAPVTIPVFPASFVQLLAKTLAGIAADAERRVAQHIESHSMRPRGESWLREGLSFVAHDKCPFCGQGLTGLDLVQAYKSFFSREYNNLREDVATLNREIDRAIGVQGRIAIQQVFMRNANAVEFWTQYCRFEQALAPPEETVAEVLPVLYEFARRLLQAKGSAPLGPLEPGEAFTSALNEFEKLRSDLGRYNAAVAAGNQLIATRKSQAQAASLPGLQRELTTLKAQKARHSDSVRALCAVEDRLQSEKVALELEKEQKKVELDKRTEQVIARYGDAINRYLDRINATFRITTPTHTYRGGPPSTNYQIVINQHAVDLGDPETPPDRPSFRNTLSAGDRSSLALAFFLAQLEQDPGRDEKVVIFDDPFTSMDSFRRNQTVHQICKCGEGCAQVIVLSHEPSFLKLLWDRIDPAERKTVQFARMGGENTVITEWDIEKAVQARHTADIETLQQYYSSGRGEDRDVVQKIRPVLEGHCRNLCPTQFGEQEMMGSIIAKIIAAGSSHQLQPIADELDEVNSYCRRYHHAENPKAGTEPISAAELRGYVGRTLKLVGCLP